MQQMNKKNELQPRELKKFAKQCNRKI